MAKLRFAFLNCHDLSSGVPKQIEGLGDAIASLFPGEPADVIGLAEVGDPSLGKQVVARATRGCSTGYSSVWSGLPDPRSKAPPYGLALYYRDDRVQRAIGQASACGPPDWAWRGNGYCRFRTMAVRLHLAGNPAHVFWVSVNHWLSWLRDGRRGTESDRVESSRELGRCYRGLVSPDGGTFVALGDFNCEPWDVPLNGRRWDPEGHDPQLIHAERQLDIVLAERADEPFLYNPTWPWMGGGHGGGSAGDVGGVAQGPLGTYAYTRGRTAEWWCFDQVLISRACLVGPLFVLGGEGAVKQHPPQGHADHHAVGIALTVNVSTAR